ncbi:MAG: hypothetical protein ACE5EX_11920, partial [Phycisphaerae bacterium]
DGELSGALATELGAHRVRCADCRRALALLEVSGQIIASDRGPAELSGDFSQRLLDCVDRPAMPWTRRVRSRLYLLGPLAAAAVVVLGLLGVFDGGKTRVAGRTVKRPTSERRLPVDNASNTAGQSSPTAGDHRLDEWTERTRRNLAAKRRSGDALHHALDRTIDRWIDALESAENASEAESAFPRDEAPNHSPSAGSSDSTTNAPVSNPTAVPTGAETSDAADPPESASPKPPNGQDR